MFIYVYVHQYIHVYICICIYTCTAGAAAAAAGKFLKSQPYGDSFRTIKFKAYFQEFLSPMATATAASTEGRILLEIYF